MTKQASLAKSQHEWAQRFVGKFHPIPGQWRRLSRVVEATLTTRGVRFRLACGEVSGKAYPNYVQTLPMYESGEPFEENQWIF